MDVSAISSVGVAVGAQRSASATQASAGAKGEAAEPVAGPDNDGDQDDVAKATGKGTKLNTVA